MKENLDMIEYGMEKDMIKKVILNMNLLMAFVIF